MTAANRDQIDKLRQAIQTLEAQRAVLGEDVAAASIEALQKQIAELAGSVDPAAQQRKIATILFTDIVGHTKLVQDLDPEDNMAIIERALVRLAEVIAAHDGHIARFQGDGFKAVFGLPTAHESDPENAIRAGLGLIEAAKEYARELEAEWNLPGFNVRVGIDTGLVAAGGVTEAEDTIKGLVVNLAARLESAAPPGGLLISHYTYQHVRGVFDVEPQEPILAKGFPEPVPVYLVRRAKPRAFRMGRRGVENLETRTIGRDRELQALQEAYQSAVGRGHTTVVTLVGEAGVGKSRVAYEFNNWLELQPESIWYFKGRASQQTQGIPQYLLRDMLADRFQILDSDLLAIVREKFVAGVCGFLLDEGETKAHVLGTWLGYDFSDSPHLQPIRDEPEQIKNRATLYLAQFFTAIAAQGPAVILLDNIHWADGGSLDGVTDLARRRPELPLLVVCLSRPSLYERRPDWDEQLPVHTRVDLAPLSSGDTRALVAEILRLVDPLPQVLLELVSSRAEGNPFYAEELVKMLIDDGVIYTGTEAWGVVPEQLLELKVPATLAGVLQARLDRLPTWEKQAVQQAAVIGRVFWDQALAVLGAEAPQALPTLQAKEFIFPRAESAFVGTAEYIFKHALLRDVTYETVLRRVRGQYHALVADWLAAAAEVNGRGDEYAPLIGEHYQLAGDLGQAAGWYGRAGRQAASTYAHGDAAHYLGLALKLTPEDEDVTRFALLEEREKAYHMQGDREAQRDDLNRLAALASRMGDVAQARAALRQASYAYATSVYPEAIIQAQAALERVQRGGDLALAAEGHWVWGRALKQQGQYPAAQEQFETGLHLAQEIGDLRQVANCLNGLGDVNEEQGDYAAARRRFEQALAISREIGDRSGEGTHLKVLGIIAAKQGDYTAAGKYFEQALVINRETGDRIGESTSVSNIGFAAWNLGDYAAARTCYEHALVICREIGNQYGEGGVLINLGHLSSCQGRVEAAKGHYAHALAIQREIGDRWGAGISLNELGAVALAQDDLAHAESCYQQALVIRQELIQPQYLVEDWAGLAKLKLAQGDREAARKYGQQILDYLKENPSLEGAENPMRAFHFTWQVLVALDQTPAANEVLELSAQIIQEYLDQNSDPAMQEMYLAQPHHGALWAAWRAGAKED
jgi:class 3 adenylate cyclase/tetratricopeptide (TPR) repeat protein